jgi:hypothetical protein
MVDSAAPEAIAEGLLALLGDAAERRALGQRARGRAEREFPYARRKQEMARLLAALPERVSIRRPSGGGGVEAAEPGTLRAPGE